MRFFSGRLFFDAPPSSPSASSSSLPHSTRRCSKASVTEAKWANRASPNCFYSAARRSSSPDAKRSASMALSVSWLCRRSGRSTVTGYCRMRWHRHCALATLDVSAPLSRAVDIRDNPPRGRRNPLTPLHTQRTLLNTIIPTEFVVGIVVEVASAHQTQEDRLGGAAALADRGRWPLGHRWSAAFMSALVFTAAPASARAADGCTVLLCLAGNWRNISQCVPPVRQALRDLMLGRGFPVCGFG